MSDVLEAKIGVLMGKIAERTFLYVYKTRMSVLANRTFEASNGRRYDIRIYAQYSDAASKAAELIN